MAVSSEQKMASPIQNRLREKMLTMKTIAQKMIETIWETQKIATLAANGTRDGFLDSNIHSSYPVSSDSWLHQRSPTSLRAVRFLVTQKSMLMSWTVRMKVAR